MTTFENELVRTATGKGKHRKLSELSDHVRVAGGNDAIFKSRDRYAQFEKEGEIMKFETIVGLTIFALLIIVGGLANHFIDGLGV